MKLLEITALINKLLAGERHNYQQFIHLLDMVIDDINDELQATYPTFSELPAGVDNYNFFPDRYVRQVVVTGAAYYYYIQDEEGIMTAPQYMNDYFNNRFKMLRDYMTSVPPEYQRITNTALYFEKDKETGERGITVDSISILP
jgi:hypothetical protein